MFRIFSFYTWLRRDDKYEWLIQRKVSSMRQFLLRLQKIIWGNHYRESDIVFNSKGVNSWIELFVRLEILGLMGMLTILANYWTITTSYPVSITQLLCFRRAFITRKQRYAFLFQHWKNWFGCTLFPKQVWRRGIYIWRVKQNVPSAFVTIIPREMCYILADILQIKLKQRRRSRRA